MTYAPWTACADLASRMGLAVVAEPGTGRGVKFKWRVLRGAPPGAGFDFVGADVGSGQGLVSLEAFLAGVRAGLVLDAPSGGGA